MSGKRKILIVDDNANDRKVLRLTLERRGCEVLEAADGEDALEKAWRERPGLIISDALMPRMDGFQLLHRVKGDPGLRDIPFVFYSAVYTGGKDEELALSLGADAFVVKPKDPRELWEEVSAVLEGARPGEVKAGTGKIEQEEEYLQKYSLVVATKLEEKVRELEREIAERKRAEEALRESEARYLSLVNSTTDYIYTVQVEEGRPTATVHGPGCVAVTGYTTEEFAADPGLWFRMVHEEDRQSVEEQAALVLSGEAAPSIEHRIIRKDGEVRWIKNKPVPRFDLEGGLVAYDGLISDITERRKLEAQLRQAQKMEAVGQLAGGIAHDFNNILTAIIGYGSLMKMQMQDSDPLLHNTEQIIAAAERAANLTHGLLAFSRKQIINPRPVNLTELVRSVEKLLSRLITEDITLRVHLSDTNLTIMADPGQIDQILINLATNARDAMPEGGDLVIETGVVRMDKEYIKTNGYGAVGSYVLLSVTDTGVGMDEKTRQRIFEPFFTTKEEGKGTGLGLAIVYGIVKQHNGFVNCYSEPGKGTTFKIYFPLVKTKVAQAEAKLPIPALRGDQTILVADDDAEVRNIIRAVLEVSGYEVVEACDGEAAVRNFTAQKDKIELLLLDVVMPRKNGREALNEIRKIKPDIRALFTSGYTADVIQKKGGMEKGMGFIIKPISPRDLLLRVREALEK